MQRVRELYEKRPPVMKFFILAIHRKNLFEYPMTIWKWCQRILMNGFVSITKNEYTSVI